MPVTCAPYEATEIASVPTTYAVLSSRKMVAGSCRCRRDDAWIGTWRYGIFRSVESDDGEAARDIVLRG